MYDALALDDTPQGHLEALAVAKAVPLVAEPMAEHLVRAVLAIANADLERTEQGSTESARIFLGDAYRIRVEALERAADARTRATGASLLMYTLSVITESPSSGWIRSGCNAPVD